MSASQRLLFAAERYGEHELANHAAAGAYAFLLSATPAVLLVLGLASALLRDSPAALEGVERLVAGILGPLDAEGIAKAFFGRPLGRLAAVIGGASLVWAARLFVVTVQRGLRVIWAAAGRNAPVKENLLTFALELACLVAVVAVLAAAQTARLLATQVSALLGPFAANLVAALAGLAPATALLFFIYGAYRYAPAVRPSRRSAAASSLLCLACYAALSRAFSLFISSGRYALLYGFFGGLILLLVNVYAFFCLFYYFAELTYVREHFDALLLGRFHRVTRRAASGDSTSRLERALFLEPERLMRAYGHRYGPGQTIFEAGTTGRDTFFVHRGKVGVYTPSGVRVGTIGPGEVFGEMASVLDEARTATIRAEEESLVLAIPPEVFSVYLKADAEANRRLVAQLSARLKDANSRARGTETNDVVKD
jgi:YihY family inner membrane protein